ncbi:hypothetical protein GCM10010873_26630 [Cypionkella aquatica]|uniref:Head-tail adaptor protein n=1 Tax=Cypionkella aquatica TaxID=1756042 RepID=A0AA37TU77_9RHOB|nr:head-tail adaptor protein [Cypionkella aquatica]GLS87689.1 hypothetical protein GCM10010873_26630 [Cypionkella aquatica]
MTRHHTGDLNTLVAFDAPVRAPNGMGGSQTSWAEQFQAWAKVIWLRGGETVISARLAGRQPAVFVIGQSQDSALLDTDWVARDIETGKSYVVRAIIPTDDRAFFEVTVEGGVPV